MWLSTRENRGLSEEEDMWNEIWQHQQIYTIFLRHILTKVRNIKYNPNKYVIDVIEDVNIRLSVQY